MKEADLMATLLYGNALLCDNQIKSLIMYKDMSLTVHKSHIAWHIATSMHKIIVRVEKHAHKTMTLNQCMNKINLQIKTVSTLRPAQDYTIT